MAPELLKTTDELAADTALDRRRPGRCDDVNPALISLLRTTGHEAFLVPEHLDDAGSLAASHGIGKAVLISAVVWPLIGLVTWIVLTRIL